MRAAAQLENEPRFLIRERCCSSRPAAAEATAWGRLGQEIGRGRQVSAGQVKGLTSFRPSGDQPIFRAAVEPACLIWPRFSPRVMSLVHSLERPVLS